MQAKSKILIVDDTVDIVELLLKRFNAEGYEASAAYDGEEGLQKVEAFRPDLVILDVMMPKLDGFQVLERLRMQEETKYLPVLMLTAKSKMPEKIKGLQRGADDYITKPFDYKELSTRVKSLLAKDAASKKLGEEKKSAALDHMVDEVAHEVRNPLVVIGGLARRVLKNMPPGNPNKEYMEIILQNVAALEKMVAELFELKSAALSYVEPTNINEIIQAVLDQFDSELTANHIAVNTQLIEPGPLIPVDKENLHRAFACLVENAIEAMTEEKRILGVLNRQSNGYVEIVFSDTGKGISREMIKSIYDPFFTSKTYGPGLGLTFVLKTIQNHRGMISVESEKGAGTSFTIKLPIRRGAVAG
jgi:signal transduction histidine kinase